MTWEDELAQAMSQLQGDIGTYGETTPTEPTEPEPEEEPESTPEEPGEEEETGEEEGGDDDDSIELADGTTLTRSRLQELVALESFLNSSPQTVESIRSAQPIPAQSQSPLPPQPTLIPEPPEGLDLDDPTVKFLWDQHVELAQVVEYQRDRINQQILADAQSQINSSITDWNNRYKLSDPDLKKVQTRAAEIGTVGTLVSAGRSVYSATNDAMEAAFWSIPELRNQFLTAQTEDQKRQAVVDRKKQQKLSALAGRGGSTPPRQPPESLTREQRQEAMVAELQEYLDRS